MVTVSGSGSTQTQRSSEWVVDRVDELRREIAALSAEESGHGD